MIDTEVLRKKVIELAIQGKLTQQLPEDGNAEDLYTQIQEERARLIKEGKIKKDKPLPEISADEIPFEIPDNWKWVRIGQIFTLQAGKNKTSSDIHSEVSSEYKYPCYGGNGLRGYVDEKNVSGKHILIGRQGALCGNINIADNEFWATEHAVVVYQYGNTAVDFYEHLLRALDLNQYATSVAQPGLAVSSLVKVLIPLPPLDEQKRIVEIIDKMISLINIIDEFQQQYEADCEILKGKIIDAGIQGKLTEQLPEDGNADDLYAKIQEEKAKLIKEGKIKNEKSLPEINDDEIPFEIPSNWKWVRFGETTYIERGGSPRPIKSYITNSEKGINWIKIGDVEKGGKYILSTKEKILPEGEKKSRHVYPGDFLLTNSMSFGRPYISKVEGCIHDGWLLIRNLNGFCTDYLYYLLSSTYMYSQFCNKASGATVDNLNIEKVNTALIPLAPIDEQERVSSRVEEILGLLQKRDEKL